MPAFDSISDEVSLTDIKKTKINAFYKEYETAIHLARIILKRFGYNITNVIANDTIETAPFWIDMSKLFEIYVLGLLKERFSALGEVHYHFTKQWNELDYLIKAGEYCIVGDAKYKTLYKNSFEMPDIRQLSGYARIKDVVDKLGTSPDKVVDCLIFYPDQGDGEVDLKTVSLKDHSIQKFIDFYKIGIRLPTI